MLKNYLLVAVRNLLKYKSYSLINISGLAFGIACCILILLWVRDELSYDQFHTKADRIVRVVQTDNVVTPAMVAPFLKRSMPEIETDVRLFNATQFGPFVIRRGDRIFQEKRFFFADSTVFDVFTLPFLEGGPAGALSRPQTIVLTETASRKYFGDEDPIGQTIIVNSNREYEVTGVIQDVPKNSHLKFDFIASYVSLTASWARNDATWDSANLMTYFLVRNENVVQALEGKIETLLQREFGEQLKAGGTTSAFFTQPLTDIHLHSKRFGETNGDIVYVYGFSAVAILILLIACINYMNLATARSTRRAREVGMRKVLGAVRSQISRQFFGESALVTLCAILLSLGLVHFFLPMFNALAGKQLTLNYTENPFLLWSLLGVGLAVSLISGVYPAILLSGFRPVAALKGKLSEKGHQSSFRNKLVVFQFAVSIALIIATLVVRDQLAFVSSKNLGFSKEQIVVLPIGDATLRASYPTLKSELLQHANILSASAADGYPGNQLGGYLIGAEGLLREEYPAAGGMVVDQDIAKTLGLEVMGRGFPKSYTPEQGYYYIINEALLGKLGWTPETALGKQLNMHGRKGPIVGVSKDFHFMSLHNPIYPLAMFLSPEPGDYEYLLVKFSPGDVRDVLRFMEAKWSQFAPHRPFEYSFLDEEFGALYRAEEQVGRIFLVFSGLTIAIACLGLFGLSSFTAEQRTKEIGIRKVLGASVPEILVLLSKDFATLVGLAFVVAAPLAYFAMNSWLQSFAYRVSIGMETILAGGFLVLLIALLVVSYQAISTALSNPIDSLRCE